MDTATMNTIREQLMSSDTTFRQLASEHHKYENRLNELSSLNHPSEEEQREEALLKRKKLAVKDQMYAMLVNTGQHNQLH